MDGGGSKSKLIREEQNTKKLKQGDDKSNQLQVEGENQVEAHQACFEDLPPEMLKEILNKLEVSTLLCCRLVNRKWNELSRELLKSAAWIRVKSNYKSQLFVQGNNQSVENFVTCFKKSKNFPYSRYHFEMIYNPASQDLRSFISCCQSSIKSLDLRLRCMDHLKHIDEPIGCVRDLLLNKLPNLEEFGLRLDHFQINKYQWGLFPKREDQSQVQVKPFQLPKLKVVRLSPSLFKQFPGVAKDLLEAAVNLKKIDMDVPDTHIEYHACTVDQLEFLHSLGKLGLLQTATISPSVELGFWIKNSAKQGNPVVFKLTKLTLNTCVMWNEGVIWPQVTASINKLFKSVKDTVQELKVDEVTFLGNLKFPRFTKLTKLSTIPRNAAIISVSIITFLKAQSFPVLQELDLSAGNVRFCLPPEDLISVIPSVKRVKVSQFHAGPDFIKGLAKMCPNLTVLKFTRHLENFSSVASFIWTHMKKLESIGLVIYGDSEDNSMASIVSTFTGISKEKCQVLMDNFKASEKSMPLSKKLNAKKSLKVSNSEMEKMRENVSILDLKELRKLDMGLGNPELSHWDLESCIQIIKIYAFDYMLKLDVSTRIFSSRVQLIFHNLSQF